MRCAPFFENSWDVAARLAAAAAAFMGGGNLRALCLLMIMDYVLGVSLALLGIEHKNPRRQAVSPGQL